MVVERAVRPRLCGSGVAAHGEGVLGVAADLVLLGQDLGGLAQAHRPARVHARVDHAPAERRRVHGRRRPAGKARSGPEHHPRGAGHRLDAAGHDDGRRRPSRSAAQASITASSPLAHRRLTVLPGHRRRQAGEQHRHPGHVAVVLAGLVRRAEHDLVDACRARTPRRSTTERTTAAARSSGRTVRQRPAVATDGRAHGVEDEDVTRPCRWASLVRACRSRSTVELVAVGARGDRRRRRRPAAASRWRRAPASTVTPGCTATRASSQVVGSGSSTPRSVITCCGPPSAQAERVAAGRARRRSPTVVTKSSVLDEDPRRVRAR